MKTDSKMLELPNSWAAVKLGDFVENEKGKKPKNESKAETISHSIPYVDIQAFEENVIRTWTDGVGCRLCYETDFLMVWDGSRSGLVGKGMNGALGSTLVRIYFPSMVNDYAFYFLKSKYQQINTRAKGVGIPHVDPALLWNYDFPIPPLNEQHRIVAKIEELFSDLDKGIENLKAARAQLKVYRQALLKHAFEGKLTAQWRAERHVTPAKAGVQPLNDMDSRLRGNVELLGTAAALLKRIQQERAQRYQQQLADWQTNGGSKPKAPKPLPPLTAAELAELPELPEGWGWVRPGEICVQESYAIGIGPFGSNLKVSDYRESGVPLIFVKNITRSNFSRDLKYIDEEKYKELMPHSVKALDLLITKMGDPPGDCEIYPEGSPNAVLTADCLKFRLWDEYANRKLYKYCINSNFVKRQLGFITKGVAQKKISVERFKTICLPLFCVEEQKVLVQEIESKLSECDQLELTLTTSLQQAEALRQSILKKAFSGQLVPQDPHDEPASALLARIKAERVDVAAKLRKKSVGYKLSPTEIPLASMSKES